METLFAQVVNNSVVTVIVSDQSFIDTLLDPTLYIETFVNAHGDAAKRYNYATIGGSYDAVSNAFIAPSPGYGYELDDHFAWQPTPVFVSQTTYKRAIANITEVAPLRIDEIYEWITQDSRDALSAYLKQMSFIASTANISIREGVAYSPEFPVLPTVVHQLLGV